MACSQTVQSKLECKICATILRVAHATGSDPVLKAKLRNYECKECGSRDFILKELGK